MQFTREREFSYDRRYRGPIRAVIFDWAGTTMDFGCMAPAVVFQKVYDKEGVPISMEEARVPMGAHKKLHIGSISQLPSVRRRWVERRGAHYVIDSIADLMPVLDDIEARLERGEKP